MGDIVKFVWTTRQNMTLAFATKKTDTLRTEIQVVLNIHMGAQLVNIKIILLNAQKL